MLEDRADEDKDSPHGTIEPCYRLILRLAFYAVVVVALIYLGSEMAVYLFHIRPSPDATIMLPALV